MGQYVRKPGTSMIGGYLPDEEVALIDAYLQHLREENPGTFVSRVTAIRSLCLLGLDVLGRLPEEMVERLPAEKASRT